MDTLEGMAVLDTALSADDALDGVGRRKILVILSPGEPGLVTTGVFAVIPAVGVVGLSVEWS